MVGSITEDQYAVQYENWIRFLDNFPRKLSKGIGIPNMWGRSECGDILVNMARNLEITDDQIMESKGPSGENALMKIDDFGLPHWVNRRLSNEYGVDFEVMKEWVNLNDNFQARFSRDRKRAKMMKSVVSEYFSQHLEAT